MPQVLTTNAIITCPHGGIGTSIASDPKWIVEGGAVLLEGDMGTIACPFIPLPCTSYILRSMGLNASSVDGRKVILVTDFNLTYTGLPLTIVEQHHCQDNSTPVAIPVGQDAPPLSPEMLDMTPPTVTVVGPTFIPFITATSSPTTGLFSFNLSSPHPMQWSLVVISENTRIQRDLTAGSVDCTPVPAGGEWNSPSQPITVPLTAAFMSSLKPGNHHFYLIAVNKRGLSSYAQTLLTVS
jgi:hypothetical protein